MIRATNCSPPFTNIYLMIFAFFIINCGGDSVSDTDPFKDEISALERTDGTDGTDKKSAPVNNLEDVKGNAIDLSSIEIGAEDIAFGFYPQNLSSNLPNNMDDFEVPKFAARGNAILSTKYYINTILRNRSDNIKCIHHRDTRSTVIYNNVNTSVNIDIYGDRYNVEQIKHTHWTCVKPNEFIIIRSDISDFDHTQIASVSIDLTIETYSGTANELLAVSFDASKSEATVTNYHFEDINIYSFDGKCIYEQTHLTEKLYFSSNADSASSSKVAPGIRSLYKCLQKNRARLISFVIENPYLYE